MSRLFFRKIFAFACFIFAINAHGANIRGKVTDKETGEDLVGAYVYLKETRMGTSVGLDGTFTLKQVPVGKHTVIVSFVSYRSFEKLITVTSEALDVSLEVSLSSMSSELDEITIVGSKDLSSENSARATEKDAVTVMNVVSAKAIELSPDLNIANVVQRMSGITLDKSSGNGATYALLRGMDKRYNYTLVNGIKIPSTNNKHRYVPLDIFPSDLVDRIEVTKAITADMEGDAIAGAVNLIMKNAPDRFLVMANASVGHSQILFEQSMKTFDTKAISPKSPYELNPKGYEAVPGDFTTRNLALKQTAMPVNAFAGLTLGNRFLKKKLGVLVSGTYQTINRATSSLLFDEGLSRDGNNLPTIRAMKDRTFYEYQSNYGVHSKLDYRINSRHQVKLYIANMNFKMAQVRSADETDLYTSYQPEKGTYASGHSERLRYTVQNLFNATLQGEHQFSKAFSANWSAVYSKADNRRPDEATFEYITSYANHNPLPTYNSIAYNDAYRIWRYNNDEDRAGYLNIKYTAKAGAVKMEYSAGGMYRMKTRTSFYNKYNLSTKGVKGKDWDTYDEIKWTYVINPRGTIGTSENFDALENVLAYYGMAKFNIKKVQVIGGLRIENTEQGYRMLFPQGERRPSETYLYADFLPSLHVKYELTAKHNLRATYYKATNKPGFQEIVPFRANGDDFDSAGNPDLKQAVADNADLRWEFYPTKLDQVMVGVFYKHIKNAIEYAFVPYLGNEQVVVYSPINTDLATNYGLEADFTRFFSQFGIKANYTFTRSRITTEKISQTQTLQNRDTSIFVSQTRPLTGQSAHVANLSLLYQSTRNGLNAQLAFSYTGDRIYYVSRFIDNDLWQKGFWQLDFSAEKRFRKGLSVFVKAQNLLNTPVTVYIKGVNPDNSKKPYHSSDDKNTLIRNEYTKAAYLAGVRYKF